MIRTMQLEDLDRVVSIEQENFSRPWSYQGFADAIAREQTMFLVCESDGQVAGYIGAYLIGTEMEITNVSVAKTQQGRGFGKALLLECLSCGKAKGIEAVTLEVRVSNKRAIALYHLVGFEDAGVRPGFYEAPKEDALIMWKR